MKNICKLFVIITLAALFAFSACNSLNNRNLCPVCGAVLSCSIDHVFDEIIAFAKKLAGEIEYDSSRRADYTGAPIQHTPGKRLHLCGGYAQEVLEKAILLPSVKTVQYWYGLLRSGVDHAWNVLKLVDGRMLYFDLTGFSNQRLNSETGEICRIILSNSVKIIYWIILIGIRKLKGVIGMKMKIGLSKIMYWKIIKRVNTILLQSICKMK